MSDVHNGQWVTKKD